VEHAFVLAMFAEKSHVLAQIHILKVICNETAVASLNALSEFAEHLGLDLAHNYVRDSSTVDGSSNVDAWPSFHDSALRGSDELDHVVHFSAAINFFTNPLDGLGRIQF